MNMLNPGPCDQCSTGVKCAKNNRCVRENRKLTRTYEELAAKRYIELNQYELANKITQLMLPTIYGNKQATDAEVLRLMLTRRLVLDGISAYTKE